MPKWEYARLYWGGSGWTDSRWVSFTHRDNWDKVKGDEFNKTLRRLGDEGFELVAVASPLDNTYLFFKRPL